MFGIDITIENYILKKFRKRIEYYKYSLEYNSCHFTKKAVICSIYPSILLIIFQLYYHICLINAIFVGNSCILYIQCTACIWHKRSNRI